MSSASKASTETVELLLAAMADAIADRLESRQGARRRLLDVEQAAEYLSTSESGIYNLVADDKLRPVRIDRKLRFDVRDLDRLIDDGKTRVR
jgi:excisionase family DNA binding protein